MNRIDMIHTVGREFWVSNTENDEFSYQQVIDRPLSGHIRLDIRFADDINKLSILIETKRRFNLTSDVEQLFDYVALERELNPQHNIIAILANTVNDNIRVWRFSRGEEPIELVDSKLKRFSEYLRYFQHTNINDRTAVLENTSKLNRLLHDNGIPEDKRSQFVGTCLLALKEDLQYKNLSTSQINAGIKDILSSMLHDSLDRAKKLTVLQTNVLESQSVNELNSEGYIKMRVCHN